MTHDERRQLIETPISITHTGGRGWAGTTYAHLDLGLKGRSRSVYYDADDRTNSYPEDLTHAHPKP